MNPEQLGNAIRKRRKLLGINQADLAQLASCSKPTIVAAEAGKATLRLDKLLAILSVLGMELQISDSSGAEGL